MKRKQVLTGLVVAGLSCLGFTAVHANTATTDTLAPVVVTANRVAETTFSTKADVTVITAKEIQARHYSSLDSLLRDIPGVNVQDYGLDGSNFSANRLWVNGTDGIVVLVNGVRQNYNVSSSKIAANMFTDMDNIERVEILRGSASTLYGADAQGGVINIITKTPVKDTSNVQISLSGGSFDQSNVVLNAQGNQKTWSYAVNVEKKRSGNYKDGKGNIIVNGVNARIFNISLDKQLGENNTIGVKASSYNSEYVRPLNGGLMYQIPATGTKHIKNLEAHWILQGKMPYKNELNVYQNRKKVADVINSAEIMATYGTKPGYNKQLSGAPSARISEYGTKGISDQFTYDADNNRFVAGFDIYQDIKYNGGIFPDNVMTTHGYYVQDQYFITPEVTITPGIRYTSNSQFGHRVSKSLNLGYDNGQTNVYASYNEFFVPPNASQLYGGNAKEGLQPQYGNTIQAGVKTKLNKNTILTATAYKTRAKDLIFFNRALKDSTHSWGMYDNKGSQDIYGWNIGVESQLNDNLKASATYVHTYMPVDKADKATKFDNIDGYVPKGTLDLALTYTSAKFDWSLTGKGIFDRPGPKANVAKIPAGQRSFWLFNTAVTYHASKQLDAYLQVKNLFNKFYTDQMYLADPTSDQWYSAPGRSYQVGVTYKF